MPAGKAESKIKFIINSSRGCYVHHCNCDNKGERLYAKSEWHRHMVCGTA